MSQLRWVGLLAGVLAFVAAAVWIRHYVAETQPSAAPGATTVPRTENDRPVFGKPQGGEPGFNEGRNPVPEWAGLSGPRQDRSASTPGHATSVSPAPTAGAAAVLGASTAAVPPPEDGAATPGEPGRSPNDRFSVSFDGSATAANQTSPAIDQGVEIDPNGGAALFPPTAVLAYPDAGGVNSEEGTIALWVRRETDAQDNKGRALIELRTDTWENRIELGMGPRFLRFLLTTSDGTEVGVGSSIDWAQGEWHHVAATWGQALLALYIDGSLSDQRSYDGTVAISPSALLYVASTSKGSTPDAAPISLRGLVILQHAAAADEVLSLESQTAPPAG